MNNLKIALFKIFILHCILLFIFCNQDYNPFQDSNNTRLYIVGQSFKANDTLQIFSRETLTVNISVPDFAEMFTVTTRGNRLFKDGCTVSFAAKDNKINKGPYTIELSFVDTGKNSITLQLNKTDGTSYPLTIPFYVKTPLSRNSISGNYKENFTFKVDSVNDAGLVYEWHVEGFRNLESFVPEIKNIALDGLIDKIQGTIVVHDKSYRSQPVTFVYDVNDNYKPVISYFDTQYLRGDTILYNPDNLQFVFKITDVGCGVENTVTVNGIRSELNDSLLIKEFSTPLDSVVIVARDKSRYQNTNVKRFFVKADGSVQKAMSVQLLVIAPFSDTSYSNTKVKEIFGEVRLLGKNAAINHKVTVLSHGKSQSIQLTGGTQKYWQISDTLESKENPVTILLKNSADSVISSRSMVIIYQPGLKDFTAPVIVDVIVDSSRVSMSQTIVSDNFARVRLIVYDQESQVDSVKFGNVLLRKVDSSEYLWGGEIPLLQRKNSITFVAVNSSNVSRDKNVVIIKNHTPLYSNSLSAYREVVKGETYLDTMIVTDMDGDRIRFSVDTSVDKYVSVDQNGYLAFHATGSDSVYNLTCFASDSFEQVEANVSVKVVSDSSKLSHKVTFKTIFRDIPELLEVGKVYSIPIEYIDKGGSKPIAYTIAGMDRDTLFSMSGDTLYIRPFISDTGSIKFSLIAGGENKTYDTLSALIRVIPKNLPPKIIPDSSMYHNSVLQAYVKLTDSIAFFQFKVSDPDSFYTAAPTVEMYCRNPNVLLTKNDNQSYRIVIMKSENAGSSDTIIIRCKDALGLADTLVVPLIYERVDNAITVISPKESEPVFNDTVVFSWHKSLAGNVIYILEYGFCNDSVIKVSVSDTVVRVPVKTSGLYQWRVYLKDAINNSDLLYNPFTVRVPHHLTFKTTRSDIEKILYAQEDTLSFKIRFMDTTGVPPVSILGYRLHDTIQTAINITSKDSVLWVPGIADTGTNIFTFIATDSNKNRDTLTAVVNVIPVTDIGIEVYTGHNELLTGNQIDLSDSITDLVMKIKLKKYTAIMKDTFTINIVSSKYSTVTKADSVQIVLKKTIGIPQSNDTLQITVSSRNGLYKKNLAIVVLYQKPYKKIVVDTRNASIGSDLENVPVLVRFDSLNFPFSNKKPGFRFVKYQSTDTLPYQINSWNSQLKTGEIWVKFDKVKNNSADSVLMYYSESFSDKSNGKSVFDTLSGFTSVLHLEESNPGSIPYKVNDATVNNNNGKAMIHSESVSEQKSGIGLSKNINFGSKDYVIIDSINGFRNSSNRLTMEAWVSGNITVGRLFSVKLSQTVNCNVSINSSVSVLQFSHNNSSCNGGTFTQSAWNHIAFTLEVTNESLDSSTINCSMYCNGIGSKKKIKSAPFTMNVDSCIIGVNLNGLSSERHTIFADEVRLSSEMRSDAWVRFSYENGKPGSNIVKVKD